MSRSNNPMILSAAEKTPGSHRRFSGITYTDCCTHSPSSPRWHVADRRSYRIIGPAAITIR